MVWLLVSATKRLPLPSTATPQGYLNRAATPVPSAEPPNPAIPARVVTALVATTILRMVWLQVSATIRLPLPSAATPLGQPNCASSPVPLLSPDEPAVPARVVTSPVATTILRMVWLPESATKTLPLPSAATP